MRKLLLWLLATTLTLSCEHRVAQSEPLDTIAAEQPLPTLPDTALPSAQAITYTIEIADTTDDGTLSSLENLYTGEQRWFTFRANARRDADYGGTVRGTPSMVVKDWQFDTHFDTTATPMGTWGGGTGWTGQPLYIKWSEDEFAQFRQSSPALTSDFGREEIIISSLCGKVYFLNFHNGRESRHNIDVTNPIKGTSSLEPTARRLLFVGQGIPKVAPMGQIAIDLLHHKRTFFSGADRKAHRGWHAFDSSPVCVGGYLFWPGENGTIYKYKIRDTTLTLHSALRYRCRGVAPGVESSLCVYNNYGFFGDNAGNIICIELNTLRPIWHYNNHDDIDATIVCAVENGVPYLYSGCEVDKQGDSGICHFVKLNALDGTLVWEQQLPCRKLHLNGKHFDGGLYCTPLLGQGDCDSLIFANICQRESNSTAEFTAFHKQTGEIVYRTPLAAFAWSSPVAFYNERRQLFVFTGDSHGNAYLIEGRTGRIIFKERMVNNFESSPVVVGNHLVVGSRGKEIYRFSVVSKP